MKRIQIGKLLGAIAVCEAAGLVGAVFTAQAIESWYMRLAKPALNPPNQVFAPVWGTLYLLMGVVLYLIWQSPAGAERTRALRIFFIQLALNVAWSFVFFGLRNPGAAFLELAILFLAIIMTVFYSSKVSRVAVWLLAPYILWVIFAGYLNFSVWQLNRDGRIYLDPFDTALAGAPARSV